MTRYVAIRNDGNVVVDELYNLKQDDEIIGEVTEDGASVKPRNLQVNPYPGMRYWPANLFVGPAVALREFVTNSLTRVRSSVI